MPDTCIPAWKDVDGWTLLRYAMDSFNFEYPEDATEISDRLTDSRYPQFSSTLAEWYVKIHDSMAQEAAVALIDNDFRLACLRAKCERW